MTKSKAIKEVLVMAVTLIAIYHATMAIVTSVDHQAFLHKQMIALKAGQAQAQQVNKELRAGLADYRSSNGIEKLGRERLNLSGKDEVIIRIGK